MPNVYVTSHPLSPCSLRSMCSLMMWRRYLKTLKMVALWLQLETVHRCSPWRLHITDTDIKEAVVEQTGSVTTWVRETPLFSACVDIHALFLCTFPTAAVLLTRRDSSPCIIDGFAHFPRTTSMVETSNNLFRSYYCADIHAQLRMNLKGRRGSLRSRRACVAWFSFTKFWRPLDESSHMHCSLLAWVSSPRIMSD